MSQVNALLAQAEHALKEGREDIAEQAFTASANLTEIPHPRTSVGLARMAIAREDWQAARLHLGRVVDAGDDYAAWDTAARLIRKLPQDEDRAVSLHVLGSATNTYMVPLLQLAALRRGLDLTVTESAFGQYHQDVLDPGSRLYSTNPDMVLLALHLNALGLPNRLPEDPDAVIDDRVAEMTDLWRAIAERTEARVIQFGFVPPADEPLGHLSGGMPGSHRRMVASINVRLNEAAGGGVAMLDCHRLATKIGMESWHNPRWWMRAKLAVSFEALPLLSRHVTAVMCAQLGMTKKVLALDLDNTMWGGVIGEEGLSGIELDGTAVGESHLALQDYVLALKERGVLLCVASKNDDHMAKLAFLEHPDMQVRLSDFAAFEANWGSKVDSLTRISKQLDIGLDSFVFVDDNPVERAEIRQFLPEVEVVTMPDEPSLYVRALDQSLLFESAGFTDEDRNRTAQYHARAAASEVESNAGTIEDFLASLEMISLVRPFVDGDIPRIVQLINKTNQFNVTTIRHDETAVRRFMNSDGYITRTLRLSDRFTDHGLVGVVIAEANDDVMRVDTWLQSCRVIGRTVEFSLLNELVAEARDRDLTAIDATYVPTPKNELVRELFPSLGFQAVAEAAAGTTKWRFAIQRPEHAPSHSAPQNPYVSHVDEGQFRDRK